VSYPSLRVLADVVRPSDLAESALPTTNVDRYGRTIDYLRISITDRCNLRCVYCMPEEGVPLSPRDELLSFEEHWRIAKVARALGFRKFRVTGGEPLVVRDVVPFLRGLRAATAGAELCMTTNGIRLPELIDDIKAAGVDRLNISLDTLDAERFRTLTRRDGLAEVMHSIDRALDLGFSRVKINAVIVPGVNEVDLVPLAALAETRDLDVRFIEEMPLDGHADRGFIGADEMARRIAMAFPLERAVASDARASAKLVYTSKALRGRIAFIAPRSQKFCETCHRMRLTPHGELKGCLLSEGTIDLRTPLREGITDADLDRLLRHAIGVKPREYQDDRYGLDRPMSAIGG
jgi:GTP 3',8-cyclase